MAKLRDDGKPRIEDVIKELVAQAPPLSAEAVKELQRLVATGKVKKR